MRTSTHNAVEVKLPPPSASRKASRSISTISSVSRCEGPPSPPASCTSPSLVMKAPNGMNAPRSFSMACAIGITALSSSSKSGLFMLQLLLQLHNRCARSALILRRRFEARDVWMAGQQVCNRAAQRTGAVAVNYAYFAEAVQESFVEKLVYQVDSFVSLLTD